MTPETREILDRHYYPLSDKRRLKRLGPPTREELDRAAAEGFPPDDTIEITHDDAIERLMRVAQRLSLEEICGAFVAGVGGSFLRGRQPLISYAYAMHLTPHTPTESMKGSSVCEICGLQASVSMDRTDEVFGNYSGSVWNELPARYVVDLEEFVLRPRPAPTESDRAVLRALLELAAGMPAACTPSQLEKEVLRWKIVPLANKYHCRGILQALAEVGVLPNPAVPPSLDRFVSPLECWAARRKFKVLGALVPLGAWRGALGVDWDRAKRLFGV